MNDTFGGVTSVALFSIATSMVYSGSIILSGLTGVTLPGALVLLLYPSTMIATYWADRVSKPFFEKARGIEPQAAEELQTETLTSAEKAGHLALGILKSLAIWSLCVFAGVFTVGLGSRMILGRAIGVDMGRLFWILVAAPITGSCLSMYPIHHAAGNHFRKFSS